MPGDPAAISMDELLDPPTSVSSPKGVLLYMERKCSFKKKTGSYKGRGCQKCEKPKLHEDHLGIPPSFNTFIGTDFRVWLAMKDAWQAVILRELQQSGLEKGLAGVEVEAWVCWPQNRADRDEGNFRVLPEKALGDALVEGGFLETDRFGIYHFGRMHEVVRKGESWMRIRVTPMVPDL